MTTDDFIPTTEQVRSGYAQDPVAEYYDPITNHTAWGERAFNRWLILHDAEVAAKSLEQAADRFDHMPIAPRSKNAAVWLRAEAAEKRTTSA